MYEEYLQLIVTFFLIKQGQDNLIGLGLTLIPLGYFEDLSPLGGGGCFGPHPPSDLGN